MKSYAIQGHSPDLRIKSLRDQLSEGEEHDHHNVHHHCDGEDDRRERSFGVEFRDDGDG